MNGCVHGYIHLWWGMETYQLEVCPEMITMVATHVIMMKVEAYPVTKVEAHPVMKVEACPAMRSLHILPTAHAW